MDTRYILTDQRISGVDFMVWAILREANKKAKNTEVYLTDAKISRQIRKTRRTVQKSIKRLKQLGYVTVKWDENESRHIKYAYEKPIKGETE